MFSSDIIVLFSNPNLHLHPRTHVRSDLVRPVPQKPCAFHRLGSLDVQRPSSVCDICSRACETDTHPHTHAHRPTRAVCCCCVCTCVYLLSDTASGPPVAYFCTTTACNGNSYHAINRQDTPLAPPSAPLPSPPQRGCCLSRPLSLSRSTAREEGEQVAAQVLAVARVGVRDAADERGRGHQPERVRVGVPADACLWGAGYVGRRQDQAGELRGCRVFEE